MNADADAGAEKIFDEANGRLAVGEVAAAADGYRRATELAPEFFDAWHALCVTLVKLGNFSEAVAAGRRALALRPDDQMACTSLSIAYARNGQIKEAEAMAASARVISWGGKAVR
jgi:Flp pilus assembly protein TadD